MSHKKALVTGASRGIGKAVATALAREKYDLYLVCQNNKSKLDSLSRDLSEKYDVKTECFYGNVGDSEFVSSVYENITELDVLINNAGISFFGLLPFMTDEQWHNVISCNLDSVFYFCRKASALMLEKHSGRIINISSVWGERGSSMEVAYSASKGGVNAFTKALAKELAPSGICVNAIACGLIDTDMNKHLSDDEIKELTNEIPADRMGLPDEVGNMIVSMLNAPSYMTGQIITLDGGWI